jgi:hypothetical protein
MWNFESGPGGVKKERLIFKNNFSLVVLGQSAERGLDLSLQSLHLGNHELLTIMGVL